MSETTPNRLNLDEIISRIEKQQAETRKFVAERDKTMEETLKLERDRKLSPWPIAVSAIAAFGAWAATIVGAYLAFNHVK